MEILIPITFFAMIAALVIVPRYFKSQERLRLQETLRAAIDKGQPLPPEVVEALTRDVPDKRTPSPERDVRKGVILLCVAAALVSLSFMLSMDEPDAYYPMIGAACFPGFLGLAFVAMGLLSKSKSE
jgi:hypothetical protein